MNVTNVEFAAGSITVTYDFAHIPASWAPTS